MTARSRAQQLRDALEQDILLGVYEPGTRLDEVSLAARFGVSRTPVREALAQLSSAGLIEMRPRRGAFVRTVGIRELVEMFEVMAELEALCARLAARRMSARQKNRLVQAHRSCAQALEAGDADAYYYENEVFHGRIYAGCGNTFLIGQTEQLRNRLKPFRRLQLRVPQRMAASFREHENMVEALMAGDELRVGELVKAHILIQGERFNDLLAGLAGENLAQAAPG